MEITKKARTALILLCCLPVIMGATGCPNAFLESANKTSDEALLFSAEIRANASDWTGAIADISKMTTGGLAKRETKTALASYYAGRCGLNLLRFADSLKNGVGTIWPLLAHTMIGATASQFNDCKTAETTLLSINAVPAARTNDENMLLAFVEFAKMGADLVSTGADANGDGALDAGFDPCMTASIPDASVQELGTGLTIAMSSLGASGSSVAGSTSATFASLCATIEGSGPGQFGMTGFCSTTTASGFNASAVLALRALMKSNEVGFNSCSGTIGTDPVGTVNDCVCPVTP